MTDRQKPLFYIILGSAGSGRREVLADLVSDGLAAGDHALTLISADESPEPHESKLGEIRRWSWREGMIEAEVPETVRDLGSDGPRYTHVFFVTDGRSNPVDQIEALKAWMAPFDVEMARVITIIDCQLASRHAALLAWYDACVHFSDVVLLARREGIANKWMSDFQSRYRDRFIPALFEWVKAGKVKNPPLVLEPEARRVSHVFDEGSDAALARSLAPEAAIDFDDDEDEDGEESPSGDDEGAPQGEPYFERRQNGHRVIELPDIRKYLNAEG